MNFRHKEHMQTCFHVNYLIEGLKLLEDTICFIPILQLVVSFLFVDFLAFRELVSISRHDLSTITHITKLFCIFLFNSLPIYVKNPFQSRIDLV